MKTPKTELRPLSDGYVYSRGIQYVMITPTDEYYVGTLIGVTFASGGEAGGYIFDTPNDGLVEYTALGGESLYPLEGRYKELVDYLKEN